MRTCSIEGCEKKYFGRALCSMHYQRWKRNGDPLIKTRRILQTCSVEGCHNKYYGRGFCNKHYRKFIYDKTKWWRKREREAMPGEKKCNVPNCNILHSAKGLCHKHHERFRRNGSVELKSKPCQVIGCNKSGGFKGYCEFHWRRLKLGIPLDFVGRSNKGERNYNWKGGVSEYPNHSLMKRVRRQVLDAADHKCFMCGNEAKEVHHIDHSKDRHDIQNLIAVCHKCHMGILHKGCTAGKRKQYRKRIIQPYPSFFVETPTQTGGPQ